MFYQTTLSTPLGDMIAIANEKNLQLLEFTGRIHLQRELKKFGTPLKQSNSILKSITHEMHLYFSGKLKKFKTPFELHGSDFQKTVWKALTTISFGKTFSYAELAKEINRPTAYRAVAKANSTNRLAIIVPCHRVINKNGKLGGYAGGVDKKTWLLKHESGVKTI